MDNNLKILKSAFEASNLSKREYAEKLGVSASHISDILNGKGKGSNSLAELAKLRFLTKPQSGKEEEAMYRVKYEEAQAEIIALQKIIIPTVGYLILQSRQQRAKSPSVKENKYVITSWQYHIY